jgi:hypothetical protein
MPYVSIAQAAEATGKSEKTIRRLVNKPESKNYVTREGEGPNAPVQIEVSFLESVYPMVLPGQSKGPVQTTSPARSGKVSRDTETAQQVQELQHKVQLLTQELRYKDELAQQKERHIQTLERSLLLLEEGTKKPQPLTPAEPVPETRPEPAPETAKKKRWWPW